MDLFQAIEEITMAEFSNSKVNAGLTIGIIGTTLGVLNGELGNVPGMGNYRYSDNTPVNRYELSKENEITQLKMEKALIEAKIRGLLSGETYEYIKMRGYVADDGMID